MVGTRSDLEEALAERDAEIQRLRSTIERLEALIEKLTSTNGHLANQIAKLREEIARLRSQLSRALGNAPETPSGQTPTHLKPPRARTGRVPGRRKGHQGACRRPPPDPDREEDHALSRCPHCDHRVRPVRGAGFEPVCRFRYVEDVLPGASETTKHNIRQYWCGHCKRKVEPAVTAALPGAKLGIRVMVWSAVQHFVHATPTLKIVAMLRSEYGFEVTSGGLHAAWHQLAVVFYAEYEGIIGNIRVAGALHADETGWRINGKHSVIPCPRAPRAEDERAWRARGAAARRTVGRPRPCGAGCLPGTGGRRCRRAARAMGGRPPAVPVTARTRRASPGPRPKPRA